MFTCCTIIHGGRPQTAGLLRHHIVSCVARGCLAVPPACGAPSDTISTTHTLTTERARALTMRPSETGRQTHAHTHAHAHARLPPPLPLHGWMDGRTNGRMTECRSYALARTTCTASGTAAGRRIAHASVQLSPPGCCCCCCMHATSSNTHRSGWMDGWLVGRRAACSFPLVVWSCLL